MVFIVLGIILLIIVMAMIAVARIDVDNLANDGEDNSTPGPTSTDKGIARVDPGTVRKAVIGLMPEEMRGVPYLLGRIRKKPIGPGLYMRFPLLYVIEGVVVQERPVMIPKVDVPTKGGSIIGLTVELTITLPAPHLTLAHARAWLPTFIKRVQLEVAESFSGMPAEMILSSRWDIPKAGSTSDETETMTRQAYLESRLQPALADLHVQIVKAVVVQTFLPENLQARLSQLDSQTSDAAADRARADNELELMQKYLAAARAHFAKSGEDVNDDEVRAYARELRRLATMEDLRAPILTQGYEGQL